MKLDPNIVCTVEPPEPGEFKAEQGEILGFVKHPEHGVLLVDYKEQSNNGRYFAHFLSLPHVGSVRSAWVSLPSNTRILRLKRAEFVEVGI